MEYTIQTEGLGDGESQGIESTMAGSLGPLAIDHEKIRTR
jgi:hypothetical protein